MKKSIRDAAKSTAAADEKPHEKQSVDELMSEFSGKSETELMRELKSAVCKSRAAGRFDDGEFERSVQTILPLLSEGQKRKLNEIIGKL